MLCLQVRASYYSAVQSTVEVKLLNFLIIAQFVVCPHLTQWQRNSPACKMSFFLFSSLCCCCCCCCCLFFSFCLIYIYFLPIVVLFCFFIYVFFILFPVAFSYFPVFLITSCRSSEEQRQNLRLTYF